MWKRKMQQLLKVANIIDWKSISKKTRIQLCAGTAGLVVLFGVGTTVSVLGGKTNTCVYAVEVAGETVGYTYSEAVAKNAYYAARLEINKQQNKMVYVNAPFSITEDNSGKECSTEQELSEAITKVLVKNTDKQEKSEDNEQAYMVNIDGFTVTLGSREDVVALFAAATDKYDVNGAFDIQLVDGENGSSSLTTEVMKNEKEAISADMLTSSQGNKKDKNSKDKNKNKTNKDKDSKDKNSTEGQEITEISFEEKIEIIPCKAKDSQITSLEDAIAQVTHEKEKNQIYVVQSGDCLSVIAAKFDLSLDELVGMNPGMTEESFIGEGDKLIVTVPEPELSVLVSHTEKYTEKYSLPVEYVYNDNEYTSYEKVLEKGTQGKRKVTAKVTCKNGTEIDREIISEKVVKAGTPKIIEVGTQTPPTFIKPIYGGIFSDGYGYRWGTIHKGIDWACPIGTSVFASCGGTVVYAGWMSGYGNCVEIQHSNGMKTRYGHLNEVACYVGQEVKQGETVAYSGNTGNSTGPHVHFEIHVNGVQVDPFEYLQ